MLVCTPDKEERARRLKTLQNSGVVVQHSDGTMEAMSPQQAQYCMGGLDDQTRALYEPADPEVYQDMEIVGGDDQE